MPLTQLNKHNRYDYCPLPNRPDFSWPGDKRLAVCICNNIEIFSFLSGLGSDSSSVTAPQTTRNYSWRDYGNRVGQWYMFDLLDEYSLPASHNINSMLINECPQIVERIRQRGDEFIGHGRTNAERQDALSEQEEKQLIAGPPPARYGGWCGISGRPVVPSRQRAPRVTFPSAADQVRTPQNRERPQARSSSASSPSAQLIRDSRPDSRRLYPP
jgi:hypothetical protein